MADAGVEVPDQGNGDGAVGGDSDVPYPVDGDLSVRSLIREGTDAELGERQDVLIDVVDRLNSDTIDGLGAAEEVTRGRTFLVKGQSDG